MIAFISDMVSSNLEICADIFLKNWGYRSASFEEKFFQSHTKYFVAKVDENIVGFTGIGKSPMDVRFFEFINTDVMPEYRGQGIGKQLIKHGIEWARANKGRAIIGTTPVPEIICACGFKIIETNFGFWTNEHLVICEL